MQLEFVPLLHLQRELYAIPRGMERFRAYLRAMIDWDAQEPRLPLGFLNPMGKDHVPALLDQYLAFDADGVAARAAAEAAARLRHVPGAYRLTLVIVDDLRGGWTNRYATEYSHRFQSGPRGDRGWITVLLWTSEPPSAEAVREEVQAAVFRQAHVEEHGVARTLGERMAQEGYALAMAGCTRPALDADDLEYTRAVLAPYLDEPDMRRTIECLYGDAAGRTLGFEPCGLSHRAGLALALDDARQSLVPAHA